MQSCFQNDLKIVVQQNRVYSFKIVNSSSSFLTTWKLYFVDIDKKTREELKKKMLIGRCKSESAHVYAFMQR